MPSQNTIFSVKKNLTYLLLTPRYAHSPSSVADSGPSQSLQQPTHPISSPRANQK
ncbi:hypothetical protein BDV12DRAFT_66302 [Aspergillus spectabilis]